MTCDLSHSCHLITSLVLNACCRSGLNGTLHFMFFKVFKDSIKTIPACPTDGKSERALIKLSEYLVENRRLKKKRSYWSAKCGKFEITKDVTWKRCLILKIIVWCCLKKGQYSNDSRSAYEDLLCIDIVNVS